MDQNFLFRGFTDIFKVSIDKELCNLQKLIYLNTKNYLIKHKESITLEEKVNKTVHPKILILKNSATKQSWDDLKIDIEKLINITITFNSNSIKQKLQQMMPEYEPLDYSPPIPNEPMNQQFFEIENSTIKGQA